MKRFGSLCAAALCAGLLGHCASGATRIYLTNATDAVASSSYNNRVARFAVNGAGLTGDQHSNGSDGVIWNTAIGTTVSGSWIRVDLGQVYPLDSFKIWNCNFWHATVQTTNRGIYKAEVYVSTLSTTPGSDFSNASEWTRVIDTVTFAKAPGVSTYTGEPPVSLTGLAGRWFALRVLANFGGNGSDLVGLSELQVFADNTPVAFVGEPTDVSATQATLNGSLGYNGGIDTSVYLFWGTYDGGTVSSAWEHVIAYGVRPVGALSTNVSVAAGSNYFYRVRAVNTGGEDWSDVAAFMTAPVTVEMPGSVSEAAGTVPITFRRPTAVTNMELTVRFSLSGTASAGSDYVPVAGSVLLPAGAETVQVPVTLLDNELGEPSETLVAAVRQGPYLVTEASTNSTTITDDDQMADLRLWRRHLTVTLNGYTGGSTLYNFPCAVRLSEQIEGFRYSDFSSPSDGADLMVTDTLTGQTMAHEIERWDPAGTSVVWVAVSQLTGSSTGITLHWKNPGAPLPVYATNGAAWDYGFGGVWHLGHANAPDSTANANHGESTNSQTVPGLLGLAQQFNGNGYVEVPDAASIGAETVNSLSVSAWMRSDKELMTTNDTIRMLEKGDDYFLIQGYGSQGGLVFLVKKNNLVSSCGNNAAVASNEWRHVFCTYDGAALKIYVDGVYASSALLPGPIDDDRLPLRIGASDDGKYFTGIMDETRVERTVRTADWIKACYESQREGSVFGAFGSVIKTWEGSMISIR